MAASTACRAGSRRHQTSRFVSEKGGRSGWRRGRARVWIRLFMTALLLGAAPVAADVIQIARPRLQPLPPALESAASTVPECLNAAGNATVACTVDIRYFGGAVISNDQSCRLGCDQGQDSRVQHVRVRRLEDCWERVGGESDTPSSPTVPSSAGFPFSFAASSLQALRTSCQTAFSRSRSGS